MSMNNGSKITGFNYSVLGAEYGEMVEMKTKSIRLLMHRTTKSILEIGRVLAEVRDVIRRKHFSAWLEAEFSWSAATADKWIRLNKMFGDLDCVDQFRIESLLHLSRKHVNEQAVSEAIDLARSGVRVTVKRANKLVAKYQPDRPATTDVTRDLLHRIGNYINHTTQTLTPEQIESIADELVRVAERLRRGRLYNAVLMLETQWSPW